MNKYLVYCNVTNNGTEELEVYSINANNLDTALTMVEKQVKQDYPGSHYIVWNVLNEYGDSLWA